MASSSFKYLNQLKDETLKEAIHSFNPANMTPHEKANVLFYLKYDGIWYPAKKILRTAIGKQLPDDFPDYFSRDSTTVKFLESRNLPVEEKPEIKLTIHDVVRLLNKWAADNHPINGLQEFREKELGVGRPNTYKLFSEKTIFDKEEVYAFHSGGRGEAQFNIGVEYDKAGSPLFRYSLAFSIEPNQNLTNPLEAHRPRIDLFNSYINKHAKKFSDFKLWRYYQGNRSAELVAGQIPQEWVQPQTFIVFGKYFRLPISSLKHYHIIEMLNAFDRLFPVYKYIESRAKQTNQNEERISRITWNDKGWVKPSGRWGKSKDKNSFEGKHGFGYEEWMLDISKLLKGYHYAFLESVQKFRDTYIGQVFNISLYALDGITKTRHWIGEIKDVECIDYDDENWAYQQYTNRKWIDEMVDDLESEGIDSTNFQKEIKNYGLFNIRFRPENMHLLEERIPISEKDEMLKMDRYNLFKKTQPLQLTKSVNGEFTFNAGFRSSGGASGIYERPEQKVERCDTHEKIAKGLYHYLVAIYGKENVSKEQGTGFGTSIDLVVQDGKKRIFYEVKTYNTVKTSLRMAIGQLMEYSYFPDKVLATELVVVSDLKSTPDVKKYMENIRSNLNLPVRYEVFDVDANKVIESA